MPCFCYSQAQSLCSKAFSSSQPFPPFIKSNVSLPGDLSARRGASSHYILVWQPWQLKRYVFMCDLEQPWWIIHYVLCFSSSLVQQQGGNPHARAARSCACAAWPDMRPCMVLMQVRPTEEIVKKVERHRSAGHQALRRAR